MKEEQQNNQVDNIFRDGLQFHKDQPSKDLWTKIRTDLDKDDRSSYLYRRRRNLLIISALLLVMMGLGVHYIRSANNQFLEAQEDRANPSSKRKFDPSTGIRELKSNAQASNRVSINVNIKQDNNSLTRNNIPLTVNLPDSELNSSSYKTGYPQKFATIQGPETKLDIIQTDRINVTSRKIPSEEILVKSDNKSSLNKWSITTFFSQEFAGYNLSDNDATVADGREIEKRERNAFSASMGVYLNYGINRKWVVQTGLSYSWSTSNIDSAKSYAVLDNSGNVQFKLNTITGYGYLQYPPTIPTSLGDSVLTDKALSRIHYLTLPVLLSYRVPLKRFTLLVGAGVSFNLLTSATLETKIYGPNLKEQETVIPIKGIRNLNYGIILKADLEYHINNRVGVNVIPSFKNSISPINIHSALSAYPYNFGIGAGISYHF